MKGAALLIRKKDMPITPLIDMVFLLLVYFMLTAALVKKEADLPFALPLHGSCLENYPIEVLVELNGAGGISIEGEVFTARDDLFRRLSALKAAADAARSELVLNVLPADQTRHAAVVKVLDACAAAEITNLSFDTAL